MTAIPTRSSDGAPATRRVAWIDPVAPVPPAVTDSGSAHGLAIQRWAMAQDAVGSRAWLVGMVVPADEELAQLEEALSVAELPGRPMWVACRVPGHRRDWAQSVRDRGALVIVESEGSNAGEDERHQRDGQGSDGLEGKKLAVWPWEPVAPQPSVGTSVVPSDSGRGALPAVAPLGTFPAAPLPPAPPQPAPLSLQPQPQPQPPLQGPVPQRPLPEFAGSLSAVFVDPASQRLLALAQRVAQTEVTVLLVGPTGAGKEVMARLVHESSGRAEGPFVGVNCGALPEHLIEDLLFGHEKGAFSGAVRDHPGVFEQAQGGTVFLDEIGEMAPALQTRLLRVLQERSVTRLGGHRLIPVNVRVVAATNKDLKRAMQRQEFREDLYYRISTFSLRLLPLRERPLDILPLAAHVLAQHGLPGAPYRITEEARRLLLEYPWPGNARELSNVIQRALVLCPGRVLGAQHLLFDEAVFSETWTAPEWPAAEETGEPLGGMLAARVGELPSAPAVDRSAASADPSGGGAGLRPDLQSAMRVQELQLIEEAISRSPSREAAARLLGISPRTLRYKLAQMRERGAPLQA